MLLSKLIVISMAIVLVLLVPTKVNAQLIGNDARSQKYDSAQIQKLRLLGADFLHVHLNEGYSIEKYVIATIYETRDTVYVEKRGD